MTAKPYNGYPSWNAWNVSLWISSDEPLYRAGMAALRCAKNQKMRVAKFRNLTGLDATDRTPDGALYNDRGVALVIAGLTD